MTALTDPLAEGAVQAVLEARELLADPAAVRSIRSKSAVPIHHFFQLCMHNLDVHVHSVGQLIPPDCFGDILQTPPEIIGD